MDSCSLQDGLLVSPKTIRLAQLRFGKIDTLAYFDTMFVVNKKFLTLTSPTATLSFKNVFKVS